MYFLCIIPIFAGKTGRFMNSKYSCYQINAKIEAMSKFIDLDRFIQGEKNSLEQILSYYKLNEWAYRHYHSQDGFMHFRISSNGGFNDDDVYYQPDAVSKFIEPGSTVMELGFGHGANLLYLARCHPDARFIGVDLATLKEGTAVPDNVSTFQSDYSDLSRFDDNSVDVLYAVETIVHNTDKVKINREVCRVLKPGGIMIVFDYALSDRYVTFDENIQKAIALISKGGAAAMIESLDELNSHYADSGLVLENTIDFTREVLPDLKRLERKAARILKRPMLARPVFLLLPEQFVSNIIMGYLGYDCGNAGIIEYREWIVRKP